MKTQAAATIILGLISMLKLNQSGSSCINREKLGMVTLGAILIRSLTFSPDRLEWGYLHPLVRRYSARCFTLIASLWSTLPLMMIHWWRKRGGFALLKSALSMWSLKEIPLTGTTTY